MSATEPTNEKVDKIVSDDEDEDIDQLVADLQSNPGAGDEEEEEEMTLPSKPSQKNYCKLTQELV